MLKSLGLAAVLALAPVLPALAQNRPPVIFVHGDSDTAALWVGQIWRFESNGYPAALLRAVDIPHPGARGDDGVAEENRSSTTDAAAALAAEVTRTLIETGAAKVALVGNSRGCQTIRNYLRFGGGAGVVETAVLTGCVHHGVFLNPGGMAGSEYNGLGTFLTRLNAGSELVEGVRTVTIRSDRFDLYNQPMGDWIGLPGQPIGGKHEGPELKGADNRVIPGADHRETAYSPEAFAIMFEAITGETPGTLSVAAEPRVTLNGMVSGWANERPTNLPLAGARVTVFATDPATGARLGGPLHERTVGADGRWGPFAADPAKSYEFLIEAEGYPPHHIYRAPFPRSSALVNLRLYPSEAADPAVPSVGMMRPRGYFGAKRDVIELGGQTAPGVPDSEVPGVWKVTVPVEPFTPVPGRFRDERIVARGWEAGHTVWIELTW